MKKFIFRTLLVFLFFTQKVVSSEVSEQMVCIQPLGEYSSIRIGYLSRGIEYFFGFQTHVLHSKTLPKEAFSKPRQRYNADDLVTYLAEGKPARCHYILGVTACDISALKFVDGIAYDWGVMGLADPTGKNASIVSDFRSDGVEDVDVRKVLVRNALHEVVHMFGFIHHSDAQCLMAEWVDQINHDSVYLCPEVREYIFEKHGFAFPERAEFDWGYVFGE